MNDYLSFFHICFLFFVLSHSFETPCFSLIVKYLKLRMATNVIQNKSNCGKNVPFISARQEPPGSMKTL